MKTSSILLALAFLAVTASAQNPPLMAQDPVAGQLTGTPQRGCEEYAPGDIVTPHITDSHCLEYPGSWRIWEPHEYPLPRFAPIHVGGLTIDLSPTKHVVMLALAAILCAIVMISGANIHLRHSGATGAPKGRLPNIVETMVLYVRQEVALPNLGPHGEKFVPFILTLFFFILFANLLGLVPYLSTATGNISVTATLAIITFITIEIAGIAANGFGYLNTIFYWNKDLPIGVREFMFLVMSPVEVIGKISKPFALAIRLFANMTAGHIVVLGMISLIFAFQSYFIAPVPIAMAVGIMILETFVALLQAFIFALLASVFIGTIRAHH